VRIKATDFTAEIKWKGNKTATFMDIKKWWRFLMVQGEERQRNSMY